MCSQTSPTSSPFFSQQGVERWVNIRETKSIACWEGALRNTTMVDKAFSTDGGFDKSLMCRKGYIYNQNKYQFKALSFSQRKWSNVVNLPPGCWLVSLRIGAISEAQCWSLLLSDLAFSSSYSQVTLGELR